VTVDELLEAAKKAIDAIAEASNVQPELVREALFDLERHLEGAIEATD
jgi:hypothetical protein